MRCVRCGWARASPAAPAVRSWRGSGQEREDAVGIEDAVRLIGQEDVRKEKEEGVCSGAGRRGCERMLKKRLLMQVLRLWGRFVIPNLLGPSSPILRSPHLREGMYRSSPSQAKCAGSGWAGIATTTKSCGLCHRRKPRGLGSHEFLPRTRPATGGGPPGRPSSSLARARGPVSSLGPIPQYDLPSRVMDDQVPSPKWADGRAALAAHREYLQRLSVRSVWPRGGPSCMYE